MLIKRVKGAPVVRAEDFCLRPADAHVHVIRSLVVKSRRRSCFWLPDGNM